MPDRSRDQQDPSKELLERWQASGDRSALEGLLGIEIQILKSRIRAQAGYMTDPSASASDIAQEAIVRLLGVDATPRFDSPQALRAYLWVSAWRLLVARLRKSGREVAELDETRSRVLDSALGTSGGIGAVEADDRGAALAVAINLLDPGDQKILSLAYFRELGAEGAGRELGISREAASMRLVRARRELAKKLLSWSELVG
jgi:RNA polymerase sigma factor (sigma-70 family)